MSNDRRWKTSRRYLRVRLISAGLAVSCITFPSIVSNAASRAQAATSSSNERDLYDPSSVNVFIWKQGKDKVELLRGKNGEWVRASAPKTLSLKNTDAWAIHRRLVLFSKTETIEPVTVAEPSGEITLSGGGKESYVGAYDSKGFTWKNGALEGRGFVFEKHPEMKSLFDEGYLGLLSHDVKGCDTKSVVKVNWNSKYVLTKSKGKWTFHDESGDASARPLAVESFIDHLCRFAVDQFEPAATGEVPAQATIVAGKKTLTFGSKDGVFEFTGLPRFRSKELAASLNQNVDDLKDLSTAEGRIALDTTKPSRERIEAIRKMKEARSPEAIPALKAIVNEQTEIDLYRYEAVDALAAIGTKEAYKIIADRLAQIGRSGFELRLARALSMAMGRNFMSDEKTPEPQRRTEVQDLLDAYRKNPPGQ